MVQAGEIFLRVLVMRVIWEAIVLPVRRVFTSTVTEIVLLKLAPPVQRIQILRRARIMVFVRNLALQMARLGQLGVLAVVTWVIFLQIVLNVILQTGLR
jgi:hypothetical protein